MANRDNNEYQKDQFQSCTMRTDSATRCNRGRLHGRAELQATGDDNAGGVS